MSRDEHTNIRKMHLEFAEELGTDKTYCPSEVARNLYPDDWRDKMNLIRKVADVLVDAGKLVVLQKGQKIEERPSEAKGAIRLRKP